MVTMSISCTVSEIQRDIGRKSSIVTYPTSILSPHGGGPVGILPRSLASVNESPWAIVWCCLRDGVFNRFGTMPACDRRTD